MKKIILTAAMICCTLAASAQEYLKINSYYFKDVIPLTEIDSITYADESEAMTFIGDALAKDSQATIFSAALQETHLDDSLKKTYDYNYKVRDDEHINWQGAPIPFPKYRKFFYTAFVEPDEVYAKHGINNLDDLKAYAAKIYDEMHPEDATITDPTDRRNSLNRFVAYHLLCRDGKDGSLIPALSKRDNIDPMNYYDREKLDVTEWYATLMPNSIIKISYPSGSEEGLYINRRGIQERADYRGVKIRGAKIAGLTSNGIANGAYRYIDEIIHYGKETQTVTFDERIRINLQSYYPEFINNNMNLNNNSSSSAFHFLHGMKPGYVDGLEPASGEAIISAPYTWGATLNADEIILCGLYDITIDLPPVPAGTYELRMGFTYTSLRIGAEFYFDDKLCGTFVEESSTNLYNLWKSDDYLGDSIAIVANDKELREAGWMKGPKSCYAQFSTGKYLRDHDGSLRKIITIFDSDGKTPHHLRIRNGLDNPNREFMLDYIEFCPKSVYDNSEHPEDIY